MEDDSVQRSRSRGREAISSTGRGGVGNIRSISKDALKGAHGVEHEDDTSNTRGREFNVSSKVVSSGRGGAGNIHSQSATTTTRSPSAGPNAGEKEFIRQHVADGESAPHSSGRGGAGNITASRSRSRGPGSVPTLPPLHSSGRGGAGNITRDGLDQSKLVKAEAAEMQRLSHLSEERQLHSTGRGGRANITDLPEPHEEREAHHSEASAHIHSTGRGGAGNIHKNHLSGADEDNGERGRDTHVGKGVLQHVWEKVRAASTSRTRGDAQARAVHSTNPTASGHTG